ncbi:MAG: hypothetical protein GDA56_12330 [Hormoscilla sp. GM7CHS1pb]|nr:hypothetical protein [Hormoscilla sp. GM7CHS1pb]
MRGRKGRNIKTLTKETRFLTDVLGLGDRGVHLAIASRQPSCNNRSCAVIITRQ